MSLWSRIRGQTKAESTSFADVPLPILVHRHAKEALPPGPLEEGMIEVEEDEDILHAVAGIVLPDGTLGNLPDDRIEWARRLTYRHLKREGRLKDYGIPVIAAYEKDKA